MVALVLAGRLHGEVPAADQVEETRRNYNALPEDGRTTQEEQLNLPRFMVNHMVPTQGNLILTGFMGHRQDPGRAARRPAPKFALP